jgi:PQQ-dependent dehydrogenase (methanol/ethanol family)
MPSPAYKEKFMKIGSQGFKMTTVSTVTLAIASVLVLAGGVALAMQPAATPPPGFGPGSAAQTATIIGGLTPVTDAMLEKPDPADWLMWRRTLDSWGYSPLKQINTRNVGTLQLVWAKGLTPGIQEGTPLVHEGILFFPNPLDVIQAIDAATGDLKWEYRRPLPTDINKSVPFPAINRNIAIYGDNLIDTSADDFIYAVNTSTGKLTWETMILDHKKNPAQETSGPIIAKGKAISGRGCEPKGGPEACVITAHDARTGKELWRTGTIPKPGEPGDETWGGIPYANRWHVGTWMVPSYDPELNLIYIGTSVTSPAPKFALAGNDKTYLYHDSTLALNADTGKIVWYYQHLVDHWDLDHPFERLLIDSAVTPDPSQVKWINPKLKKGERRKVMTGIPGKTGVIYTLDRQTGEFLWATPTIMQNVVGSIDGATGKVTTDPTALFDKVGDKRMICPSLNGGKLWQAGAYSPLTNTMYFPLQNTCMEVTAILEKPDLASLYGTATKVMIAPGTDKVGAVHAVSVETGKSIWKYEQRAGTNSLVATGGGLLFGGDVQGRFRALDQKTGKVLWETNLGAAVTGYPVVYAVKGREYVAVSVGASLASGGIGGLTPELRTGNANNLFVFALPARN